MTFDGLQDDRSKGVGRASVGYKPKGSAKYRISSRMSGRGEAVKKLA
jgi:hypothetical protein